MERALLKQRISDVIQNAKDGKVAVDDAAEEALSIFAKDVEESLLGALNQVPGPLRAILPKEVRNLKHK